VVLAILAVIWGVPSFQNDLTTRAQPFLDGSELTVTFDGRDATISGVAEQTTIDAAEESIYNLRGVRRVDVSQAETAAPVTTTTTTVPPVATTATPEATTTTTTEAPESDRPTFAALHTNGATELWGILPDQEIIDSIEAAAIEVYGSDQVVNNMAVGEVTESPHLAFLPLLFEVADGLDPWEFSLADGQIIYTGLGQDRETVAAKRNAFAEYADSASFVRGQVSLEVDPDAVAASLTDLLAGGANFETGSAILSAEAEVKLAEVIEIMMENPSTVLNVEGHTDNQGDAASNQALSEARAQAVVDYLVTGGIGEGRLTAVGYGEARPIATNDTAEGRARNRRIEFVVSEGE
jgi:OOP family OmpA-OmpF porin